MIETRDDYEWQRSVGPDLINWFDEWTETIEALLAVAREAEQFCKSVRGPAEPGNLAKSPVAAYLHANALDKSLAKIKAEAPWMLEGDGG